MNVRRRAAVVASILAAALTGCSAADDRTPSPFPLRPVDIAVDSLSPCSMLDDSQRERLGVRPGTPRTTTVNGSPSAICTWIASNGYGYNAQSIPVSAELALTEAGATPIIVNGFGAVRSMVREMTGGGSTCQITIDAAPARAIRVQAGASPEPPLPSDEEMCRLATEAASMVMKTAVGATG